MQTVDHPDHYNQIPGIECIDVVEHMNFNRGNAIKYIWRAGAKGDAVEDLQKAIWYLQREIRRIDAGRAAAQPVNAELLAACRMTLAMMDDLYPESAFTGVSGDPGVVQIVNCRNALRAAVERAKEVWSE